jgi:hypothetical protein
VSEEAARAVQDSDVCDADEPVLDVSEASAIALQGSRALWADEPFFDGSAESAGDGPLVEDGDGPVLDLSEESAIAVQALLEARWAQEHGGVADEPDGGSLRPDPDDDSLGARQRALLDASTDSLRADARSLAARVRALHELIGLSEDPDEPGERRFLELEVAGSMRVGQLTAGRWLGEAERYVTALPLTLSLLETGELLPLQATAVLHATSNVTPELARAAEAEVLPAGCALCPSDLKRELTRVVLRLEAESDPDAVEDRHAAAAADRHVWTRPEPDGMAQAGAVLTAEQARTWSPGPGHAGEGRADQRSGGRGRAQRRPAPGGPVRGAPGDAAAGPRRSRRRRADPLSAVEPGGRLPAGAEHPRAGRDRARAVPGTRPARRVRPDQRAAHPTGRTGRLQAGGGGGVLVDADTGRPLHLGDLMPADPDPERFRPAGPRPAPHRTRDHRRHRRAAARPEHPARPAGRPARRPLRRTGLRQHPLPPRPPDRAGPTDPPPPGTSACCPAAATPPSTPAGP